MKKLLWSMLLPVVTTGAHAVGTVTVTCGSAAPGVTNNGQNPVLNISYSPDADAGKPGLFFLGALSPDQTQGAVLGQKGWEAYQGGLYPFQSRYDNGFPGTVNLVVPVPLPLGEMTTRSLVGYGLYAGHGVYTPKAQQMVASRRAMLNSVKPQRVAAGTWPADYDSDERFIWSSIQKDMVDNKKFAMLTTMPFIDCGINNQGG